MSTDQKKVTSGRVVAMNGRKFQAYVNVDSFAEVLYLAQAIRSKFNLGLGQGEVAESFERVLEELIGLADIDPSVAKLKMMQKLLTTPELCDRAVANEFLLQHIDDVVQRRSL